MSDDSDDLSPLTESQRNRLPQQVRRLLLFHEHRDALRDLFCRVILVGCTLTLIVAALLIALVVTTDGMLETGTFLWFWSFVLVGTIVSGGVTFSIRWRKPVFNRLRSEKRWLFAPVAPFLATGGFIFLSQLFDEFDFFHQLSEVFRNQPFDFFWEPAIPWTLFCGFGLMSTFALGFRTPAWLGLAIFLTGSAFSSDSFNLDEFLESATGVYLNWDEFNSSNVLMFVTFGAYQLIYILMVRWNAPWSRKLDVSSID